MVQLAAEIVLHNLTRQLSSMYATSVSKPPKDSQHFTKQLNPLEQN